LSSEGIKKYMETEELTKYVRGSGCASKIGPGDLSNILCGIDIPTDENVIVGIEGFEDAGVYKITDEIALVQTVDFFTPVVNDPYWFGQIAAANALSDIYAMGAVPKTALNMVCFSPKQFGLQILKEILRGGADKLREAGVSLLGGHSVDDVETKYGLSVTGVVHPDRIMRNEGALPGDILILTKPLGIGMMNTAIKAKMLGDEATGNLMTVMARLNRAAAEVMLSVRTHAATDVTGFGFAGHLKEMIKETLAVEIETKKLPYFPETVEFSASGIVPGGLHRNRDFYKEHVIASKEDFFYDLVFDPQTSGGLLIAVDPKDETVFAEKATRAGVEYHIVGRFIEAPRGKIILS
jgi:selenide, water dikinase